MTPVKFADFTGDRIVTGEVHRANSDFNTSDDWGPPCLWGPGQSLAYAGIKRGQRKTKEWMYPQFNYLLSLSTLYAPFALS